MFYHVISLLLQLVLCVLCGLKGLWYFATDSYLGDWGRFFAGGIPSMIQNANKHCVHRRNGGEDGFEEVGILQLW